MVVAGPATSAMSSDPLAFKTMAMAAAVAKKLLSEMFGLERVVVYRPWNYIESESVRKGVSPWGYVWCGVCVRACACQ